MDLFNDKYCLECGRLIPTSAYQYETRKYCCVACRTKKEKREYRRRKSGYYNKPIEDQRPGRPRGVNYRGEYVRKLKNCIVCGTLLGKGKAKYCSHDCFIKNRRNENRIKAGIVNFDLQKRICPGCGVEYMPVKSKQLTCSKYECRLELQKQRKVQRRKERFGTLICPTCKVEFIPLLSNQRYCCTEHGIKPNKKKQRLKRKENKEWVIKDRERQRQVGRKRRADPVRKLQCNLRSRICSIIKYNGTKKNKQTFKILGYNGDQLKSHLEHQFRDGMTWDNWGTCWHIDHIIPISAFNWDVKNVDRVIKKSFALSNLQPLTVEENLTKGSKILY